MRSDMSFGIQHPDPKYRAAPDTLAYHQHVAALGRSTKHLVIGAAFVFWAPTLLLLAGLGSLPGFAKGLCSVLGFAIAIFAIARVIRQSKRPFLPCPECGEPRKEDSHSFDKYSTEQFLICEKCRTFIYTGSSD